MSNNRISLQSLLTQLQQAGVGGKIPAREFVFRVFAPFQGRMEELDDKEIYGELSIMVCRRDEKVNMYDISSPQKRYIVMSIKGGWELSGGKVAWDNLAGDYFLRMPLYNYVEGSEARLYAEEPQKNPGKSLKN